MACNHTVMPPVLEKAAIDYAGTSVVYSQSVLYEFLAPEKGGFLCRIVRVCIHRNTGTGVTEIVVHPYKQHIFTRNDVRHSL